MHMVGSSIHNQRGAVYSTNNASQIRVQIRAKGRFDQGPSPRSAENQMQQDIAVRMRHFAVAPLGLLLRDHSSRGLPTGWILSPLRGLRIFAKAKLQSL
jgi:hypothetical protein